MFFLQRRGVCGVLGNVKDVKGNSGAAQRKKRQFEEDSDDSDENEGDADQDDESYGYDTNARDADDMDLAPLFAAFLGWLNRSLTDEDRVRARVRGECGTQ